jgi:hypothetical protein
MQFIWVAIKLPLRNPDRGEFQSGEIPQKVV